MDLKSREQFNRYPEIDHQPDGSPEDEIFQSTLETKKAESQFLKD